MNEDHISGGLIGFFVGVVIIILLVSFGVFAGSTNSNFKCEMQTKQSDYEILGKSIFENKGFMSLKKSFTVEVKNKEDFASNFKVVAKCNDKDSSKYVESVDTQIQPSSSSKIKLDSEFSSSTEWTCKVTEVKSGSYESCTLVNN